MSRGFRGRLLAIGALGALTWAYDRVVTIEWVGYTQLEIEVVVTEAGTGRPIPGALVEVQTVEPTDRGEELRRSTVTADAAGVALARREDVMCSGSRSGLGITDTFAAALLWMRVRATAIGHGPGEWVLLNVTERGSAVQRIGPGRASVVVPLLLEPAALPDVAPDPRP